MSDEAPVRMHLATVVPADAPRIAEARETFR